MMTMFQQCGLAALFMAIVGAVAFVAVCVVDIRDLRQAARRTA